VGRWLAGMVVVMTLGWAATAHAEIELVGSSDGGAGVFYEPQGVTVSPGGLVYVADGIAVFRFSADLGSGTVWNYADVADVATVDESVWAFSPQLPLIGFRHFDADGTILGTASISGGAGNGQLAPGGRGIALSPAGDVVYIADTGNNRVERFTTGGAYLGQWGSAGSGPSQFDQPAGLGVAANGDVYVADTQNNRIQHFDATGTFLGTWGSMGSGPGDLAHPAGVAVAPDQTVYVADTDNARIQHFSSSGTFLEQWSTEYDGRASAPWDVAVGRNGRIYVADRAANRLLAFADVQRAQPSGPAASVAAPWITALSATSGPDTGGQPLTLTGGNFTDDAQVWFGDTPVPTHVTRFDTLTTTTPAHAAGTVAVTVRTRAGTSDPTAYGFTPTATTATTAPPAKPTPQATCVVPDLHGRTVGAARQLATEAGCTLGTVRRTTARRGAPTPRVVAQRLAPATERPAGTRIAVTTRVRKGA
jgi:hypothetical protein